MVCERKFFKSSKKYILHDFPDWRMLKNTAIDSHRQTSSSHNSSLILWTQLRILFRHQNFSIQEARPSRARFAFGRSKMQNRRKSLNTVIQNDPDLIQADSFQPAPVAPSLFHQILIQKGPEWRCILILIHQLLAFHYAHVLSFEVYYQLKIMRVGIAKMFSIIITPRGPPAAKG